MHDTPAINTLLELVRRQAAASHALTRCATFREIVGALGQHMLSEAGRFFTINPLEYDDQGNLRRLLAIASANRQQADDLDEAVEVSRDDMGASLSIILDEAKPVLIEHVATHEPFSPMFRQWLLERKIQALAAWPLRYGERTFGVICLNSTSQNLSLSEAELQIYHVLADQVGALIQTHQLLSEAQFAQASASELRNINRAIASAENYDVLAETLMKAMPQTVKALGIALFDRSAQAGERPFALESKVMVSREGTTPLQVVDQIAYHPDLEEGFQHLLSGEVIGLHRDGVSHPILPPITLSLLQAQGISEVSGIGLRVGARLLGLLILGSAQKLTLSALQLGNLRAISDQVAISIENRGLLDQTAETLNFVKTQFEATSAVYDAKHPLEILQAFYRFSGGQFQHAHLALVEPESDPVMVRVKAEVYQGQTSTIEREVLLNTYPAAESLPALETLYVPDVHNDQFLTEAERSQLHNEGVNGLLVVPLMTSQRLIGLVIFMNPMPTTLSANRLRALRNLGDQTAVVFDNRSLLTATSATLEETRVLYEVNRSILASQDTLDILRALRQYIAPEAIMISHLRVHYDLQGQIRDVKLDFINQSDGSEQVVDISLAETIGQEKTAALAGFWARFEKPIYFIEDMSLTVPEYPLAELSLVAHTQSTISFLIRDHARAQEIITIAFSYPQEFSASQRRLYESLSDEIAIVLQNHRLLRDAQISAVRLTKQVEALEAVNQFVTTISGITDQQALLDRSTQMLVKLLNLDHSGIVLVESDETFGVVASEYPNHGSVGARVATTNNRLWGELQNRNEFKPLVIADVQTDNRIEPLTRKAFNDLGIHSMAILPLVIQNRVVGGVGLDIYAHDRSITPEMVEIGQIATAQINLALQNVRLVTNIQAGAEQLKQQVGVLQTLNQLSSQISATLDEAQLLDQMVRALPDLLQVDHCGIVLLDPDKSAGTVMSEYPLTGAIGVKIEAVGNPLYEFIHNHDTRPAIVEVENDPRLSESNRQFLRGVGTKHLAILPLVVLGDVIGSIGLDINQPDRLFTADILETAQAVASQLAIGLQNIRLLNDTRRRAEQLQRVAVFSQSVQATFDQDTIFNVVLTESTQMLPIDQMSVMMYEASRQELRSVAQRVDGVNSVRLSDGELIPIKGQLAQVWSSWESLHIPDLRKVSHDLDPSVTLRSWMMVPILARGQILGIASAGSERPYAFMETDVALFSQIISQLAVAVENAGAYQQTQRTAKNEALINDISTQLQSQMDISRMLDITAQELGKALGARRARIRLATRAPENDRPME